MSPPIVGRVRNVNIWWAIKFRGREFGVSILRVVDLDRNNVSKIADH